MSLVGPRPLVDEEVAELSPAQYRYRNSVRPGVTGLWQVFRRLETSFEERIRLDLVYVGCHSTWLDLYLLFMTPFALVKGDRSF
jgi:lipopolysaccharide/colanic/teichoic acid biosynthesis glycosyltransferase